jgi:hypothetical protein
MYTDAVQGTRRTLSNLRHHMAISDDAKFKYQIRYFRDLPAGSLCFGMVRKMDQNLVV